ncbi:MAG: NADH-quinone oxidoreductase subunit J [Caldimicrobium sp.]|nr:NADH-quinone oxidoreductase subunit J [Caldimicrobium sp.]MCX7874267.1 NADH-quinone oxidoreductase subunit J [Caldimicrobium sp.]MDW8093926.1 NADH-quinone oxidoreductase subunit J [Caldimicrobium sp.]
MILEMIVFIYLSLGMIIPGILAIISKNPVHAVLWVLVLILHQAFMLFTLGSEFLTAVQIIVYAGAVIVLFLFVVYMINLKREEIWKVFVKKSPLGFVIFLIFIFFFLKSLTFLTALSPHFKAHLPYDLTQGTNLWWIARYLFTHFLFQFELVGVLLLVVVLGAVFLLRKLKEVEGGSL